jgi:hypothetical protein
LTAQEKVIADKSLDLVNVPINFGVIPATLFARICGGVKSHTWLQAHQLWCYSCHTIRQDMWWCKESYMATGPSTLVLFLPHYSPGYVVV